MTVGFPLEIVFLSRIVEIVYIPLLGENKIILTISGFILHADLPFIGLSNLI